MSSLKLLRLVPCAAVLLTLPLAAQKHSSAPQASVTATAVAALPPAPEMAIVALNRRPGFHDEPSIAVNPRNPLNLVAAYQVKATPVYSLDGGRSWHKGLLRVPHALRVSGDVSVTFGPHGAAYLCYIAFDRLGTDEYWGHNATRNGIFVRRSTDGGQTWSRRYAVIYHPTRPGIPFEDKPYIFADQTSGKYSGRLYMGWTEFQLDKTVILFSHSANGGRSWSAPIVISTHPGLPRDDNGAVEGTDGVVTRDGHVHMVWSDGQHVVYTSSHDGGKHFRKTRDLTRIGPPFFQVTAIDRANGFPQIVSGGGRDRKKRLYVSFADYRNGDVDVFCLHSYDNGKHWSAPVRVNNDPLHDGADQFFQWMAADPQNPDIYLVYYDRRNDPDNVKAQVVVARSTDGGRSFQNYLWDGTGFDAKGDFIGDYTGIAAYGGRVYGVWSEQEPGPKSRNTVVKAGRAEWLATKRQ